MLKRITLNNQVMHFSGQDLPLLIHGADGRGASLFSISVMADLYSQGSKVLFLCGYHMARDEFESQTGASDASILVENNADIALASKKRVIFVAPGTPELFCELVKSLPDLSERVIFIKNFDLFDEVIFATVSDLPNVVVAGDIDKCSYMPGLLSKKWTTQVYFSVPDGPLGTQISEMPKYTGYLQSNDREGSISLLV